MRAVIADRGPLHEDLGTVRGILDRGDQVLRAVDTAITDLAFDLGTPALGKDAVAGQVNDHIAAVNFFLPSTRDGGIARDHLIRPHLGISPDDIGVSGQYHRMMARAQKGFGQLAAD